MMGPAPLHCAFRAHERSIATPLFRMIALHERTHALLCQEDFTREASHSQCCSPARALILLRPYKTVVRANAAVWAPVMTANCRHQNSPRSPIAQGARRPKACAESHFPHYASNDQFSAARNH